MSLSQSLYNLPRRVPFFYGWCVLAAATIGVVSSIPGQTTGVGVFNPWLMDALNLSSQQISLAYGIGTAASGFLLVQAGRMVDRFGVRRSMVTACVTQSLILLFLAQSGAIANLGNRITGDAFTIAVSMIVAIFGFFVLRFAGQGLMAMIPRIMVGKWFDRRRGFAAGLMGIFTAFGFGTAPIMLDQLIQIFEWQGAYYALAGVIGVGVALFCWILFREQPQDFDLIPDGVAIVAHEDDPPQREVKHFTLSEARRNYGFWIFSFGLGGNGMVITGIAFHIISIAESAGRTAQEGLAIFLPIAILNVIANFTGGWLSDRMKLKYLLMFMMVMQALGTFALTNFGSDLWRTVAIIGFGISGGLWGTLVNVTWPRYFGTHHLGAISGQNVSIMVVATSVGPLIFASSLERLGSYTPGLILSGIIPILVLIAATRVTNPQPNAPF